MDKIKQQIEAFDNKILNAHKQVQNVICKISDADQQIHTYIQNFRNDIHQITFEGSNQYEQELEALLVEYKNQSEAWCDAIHHFIEGREFINQFEKSILVVVFGNVNVGKSSIGNLIAGTTDSTDKDVVLLKKNLTEYFGQTPEFFEYDLADGSKEHGARKSTHSCFKEGYIETTANIQYFTRKEGLTWTDSPGICSVTKENGDLAKKYVEFADLVIFVTTSSSPFKFDEIQELKKMFCQKKKPMLLLINKSDVKEKDEVDGKIVTILKAKSAENRKKQEDYAQEAFRKETGDIVTELDAISVSTYLALDAIKNQDAEKFYDSGYPRFLDKLGNVCSEQAVNLKMNAPRLRVKAMIEELIEGGSLGKNEIMGVRQYQEQLKMLLKQIEQTKEQMKQVAEDAIARIISQAMGEIISCVQDSSRDIRSGGQVALDEKINQIITKEATAVLQTSIQSVLADYANYASAIAQYKGISGVQLASKMETFERKVYETKTVSRNPRGLIENIEHIVWKKEFTETKVRTRTITESFANGDNSAEVIETVASNVRNTITSYVHTVVEDIQEGYFAKEEKMIEMLLNLLNQLEANLRKVTVV